MMENCCRNVEKIRKNVYDIIISPRFQRFFFSKIEGYHNRVFIGLRWLQECILSRNRDDITRSTFILEKNHESCTVVKPFGMMGIQLRIPSNSSLDVRGEPSIGSP